MARHGGSQGRGARGAGLRAARRGGRCVRSVARSAAEARGPQCARRPPAPAAPPPVWGPARVRMPPAHKCTQVVLKADGLNEDEVTMRVEALLEVRTSVLCLKQGLRGRLPRGGWGAAFLGCSFPPPPSQYCLLCLPLPGQATDPQEAVVKNPYARVSIPRAHLRPDLEQQLEVAPSSRGSQPLPAGPCPSEPPRVLQPTEEAPEGKGAKGTKGAAQTQGRQAWLQPGHAPGSGQGPAAPTHAGRPPVGRGDDIAHHCCCCPCCSCCHCPRFCRCHSCCSIS
ncbi:cysteine-rich tail protein 1 [Mirounga leonina]|uniref:cysteine-rich tail protein 1 n=1 Tax=Mirounga leonina TaxID=9715 RepID=UPI00156C2891|nr:cysteine-rich tail protein 1 [Mirounga leonina]